jgi:hypothetical protein
MGHINYAHEMETDYKGLINFTDQYQSIFQWNMYKIPVDNNILNWTIYNQTTSISPTLLKSTLNLPKPGDTYLDAS